MLDSRLHLLAMRSILNRLRLMGHLFIAANRGLCPENMQVVLFNWWTCGLRRCRGIVRFVQFRYMRCTLESSSPNLNFHHPTCGGAPIPHAPQFSVNIILASDGGMRVDTVPKEREAMSTGTYRPGFCYADGVLPAGKYTVVVSTYKAGKVRRTADMS